jgi:hypothetical protein
MDHITEVVAMVEDITEMVTVVEEDNTEILAVVV